VSDLEGRGFALVKHHLAKEPPSRELLGRLIDEYGVAGVMSTRSPAYKARGLDAAGLSKAQAIDLMLEDVNLIRRPLVLQGKKTVFGYAPAEYEKLG
jgi:arsenate reductase-like glutaredoxin family protein